MAEPENRTTRLPDGRFPAGVSGNPGGRPRTAELRRKSRDLADQLLDKYLAANEVGSGQPGDANAEAKVFETAFKYSGALTGDQELRLLLAAVNAREKFTDERAWLRYVATVARAAAGHDPDVIAGELAEAAPELSPSEPEQPKEQTNAADASRRPENRPDGTDTR